MVPCSKPFTCRAPAYTLSTLTNFCFSHMISLGQPDLINDSHAVYMHQITLHVLCRPAGGVEPSELPFFSAFFLLSRFPLSSLSLVNSNPPVPSLLPLTYEFLMEKPVSLPLLLLFTLLLQFLRYCCIMKSPTTLWAQSARLVFSCLLFFFLLVPL